MQAVRACRDIGRTRLIETCGPAGSMVAIHRFLRNGQFRNLSSQQLQATGGWCVRIKAPHLAHRLAQARFEPRSRRETLSFLPRRGVGGSLLVEQQNMSDEPLAVANAGRSATSVPAQPEPVTGFLQGTSVTGVHSRAVTTALAIARSPSTTEQE